MKIEIIKAKNHTTLEDMVNVTLKELEFVKKKKVLDVKYVVSGDTYYGMVIYESR